MCTLIALLQPNSNTRILFAENRDRPIESFRGNGVRLVDGHLIALYDYRSQGIVCGYSVKSGLFGGLTNVLGPPAPSSRGRLLRAVLSRAECLKEAEKRMVREAGSGLYRPANYLLGDERRMVRVENLGSEVHAEEVRKTAVAANHFHHLKGSGAQRISRLREDYVRRTLEERMNPNLEDLVEIARHHGGDEAVCRHGRTLASVIFNITTDLGDSKLLFSVGPPCRGYERVGISDFLKKHR